MECRFTSEIWHTGSYMSPWFSYCLLLGNTRSLPSLILILPPTVIEFNTKICHPYSIPTLTVALKCTWIRHQKQLKNMLKEYFEKFMGTENITKVCWILNTRILPSNLNIQKDLHDSIYCVANTAAKRNGAKINEAQPERSENKPERIPPWKRRLMRKLEVIRPSTN